MNYENIYFRLTHSRKNRVPQRDVRYELHHIIPRSMGGSNDPSNLVALTIREHFFAHLLLKRIYKNKNMSLAVFLMAHRHSSRGTLRISSRTFAYATDGAERVSRPFVTPWGEFSSLRQLALINSAEKFTKFGKSSIHKWLQDPSNPFFYYVDSAPETPPDFTQWVEPSDMRRNREVGQGDKHRPFVTPWGRFLSLTDFQRRGKEFTKRSSASIYKWLQDPSNPFFYYENQPPSPLPNYSTWQEPIDGRKKNRFVRS